MRGVILAGLCALVLVGAALPAQAQRRGGVRQNITVNNFNVRGGVGHTGSAIGLGYGYGRGQAFFGGYNRAAFTLGYAAPLVIVPQQTYVPPAVTLQELPNGVPYTQPAYSPQRERIIIIER